MEEEQHDVGGDEGGAADYHDVGGDGGDCHGDGEVIAMM